MAPSTQLLPRHETPLSRLQGPQQTAQTLRAAAAKLVASAKGPTEQGPPAWAPPFRPSLVDRELLDRLVIQGRPGEGPAAPGASQRPGGQAGLARADPGKRPLEGAGTAALPPQVWPPPLPPLYMAWGSVSMRALN